MNSSQQSRVEGEVRELQGKRAGTWAATASWWDGDKRALGRPSECEIVPGDLSGEGWLPGSWCQSMTAARQGLASRGRVPCVGSSLETNLVPKSWLACCPPGWAFLLKHWIKCYCVSVFRVDSNVDRKISASEMQRWIMEKTEEHFQQAAKENKMYFKTVDPDGDGQVSWDEYRIKFLVSKGFNEKQVAEKIKNNEELKIDEETQEVLDNLKDRWFQADEHPTNQLLNEDEFLAFLHPEHSRGMLTFMVKEIIRDLDQNGDKTLTVSEFISLPVGTVENQEAQDIDDDWVKERRKEFEEVIDGDRDGIVTMDELVEYMDPMNEYSALNEAKQMIAVADENQDHYLELEEILKYSEYFTGSKLMNYAQSVHEEF
ncbi:45 kDa calcium-binding protein [Amblyraja radiata]|uniref:45 kDa calcium-binding protein n=1 Tax=Amblyraja radiata TaxID=386614 RepID=UPI00140209DD|nr:45 kDa calcium-binding protein [Amblyraja radiata]